MNCETIRTSASEGKGVDLEEYPQRAMLKDGSVVEIRPMVREDEEGLLSFFNSLPERERLYLRNDVINDEVVRQWVRNIDYGAVLPMLALSEERIVGNCTLHRNDFGWMSHVGHIRITTAPDFRQKGLARILAGEVFCQALSTDLEMVVAELVPEQTDVRKVFSQLGFQEEAVLKGRHRDPRGQSHDILVMSTEFERLWNSLLEYCDSFSGTLTMED